MSGYEDRPPLLAPTALADEVPGLFATWALMVALYGRDVRGLPGQIIDVSLFESVFGILGAAAGALPAHGLSATAERIPLAVLFAAQCLSNLRRRVFRGFGHGSGRRKRIIQLVGGEKLLADPRFATHEARRRSRRRVGRDRRSVGCRAHGA